MLECFASQFFQNFQSEYKITHKREPDENLAVGFIGSGGNKAVSKNDFTQFEPVKLKEVTSFYLRIVANNDSISKYRLHI